MNNIVYPHIHSSCMHEDDIMAAQRRWENADRLRRIQENRGIDERLKARREGRNARDKRNYGPKA